MKPTFVCLLLCCVSALNNSTSWSQNFPSTEISLSMSGRNTQGAFVSLVELTQRDEDIDHYSSVGDSKEGGVGLGTATLRAAAFAGVNFIENGPGEPPTQVPGLMGVQVAGSAQITRPPLHDGETGSISATAIARARFLDVFTINSESAFGTMLVSGYFFFTGSMTANATANGSGFGSISSQAGSRISVSSNLFASKDTLITSLSGISDYQPSLDPILFSFITSNGNSKLVDISMVVSGNVGIVGPGFVVNEAGFATGSFDADFSQTFSWGGITEVRQFSSGEPILDWTVTSASGFDYSQVYPAVPEPLSGFLLLVGMTLLYLYRVQH